MSSDVPEREALPRLRDQECFRLLDDFRAFGYHKLTFDEVRASANRVADGKDSPTNVIDVMVRMEIQNTLRQRG